MCKIIKKIKGNTDFAFPNEVSLKFSGTGYHWNLASLFNPLLILYCRNLNFFKSRQDVPFVVGSLWVILPMWYLALAYHKLLSLSREDERLLWPVLRGLNYEWDGLPPGHWFYALLSRKRNSPPGTGRCMLIVSSVSWSIGMDQLNLLIR